MKKANIKININRSFKSEFLLSDKLYKIILQQLTEKTA